MKKITILLVLGFLALHGNAQTNPELKSLVQQSFTYFPKLQELEKSNEINSLRVDVAKSNYLPSVSGTASYSYIDPVGKASFPVGPGETRSLQFQPNNNYNANIGLNQILWDFGRTQAQVEKLKAELQAGQYNKEAAQLQLAAQVATIYYTLIYLDRAIGVQDSVIAFYERNAAIVEGKIRQGDALQLDLSNTKNSIELEKSRKVEFQRLRQRQIALLNYTTGREDAPTSKQFDFQLSSVSSGENNPELLSINNRILAAEADIKQAQRNQLPSLNLQANAGVRNGYQPDIDEIRFNYLAGVTLSVPIFQGHRLNQNVQIARRSVELNRFSQANLSASLKKDLESAQGDEKAYAEQATHANGQIELNREALRLTRVRYEKGVGTFFDLDYASTNLQRAELNKLQFEYQQCLAKIEQSRLLGVKFWE